MDPKNERIGADVLANIDHEFRTPMNAILGMTELALESELTDEQRQWLRTAKAAAGDLLVLIETVLDFSKLEAGAIELHPAPFRLRAEVADVLRAIAPAAERKGLALHAAIAADVPDELVGDAARLGRVLANLLGNAVKFTERGEVRLAVSADGDRLAFEVRDTGIGIPADAREAIFRPFVQIDSSTTRPYSGLGLGLATAARLVAQMGGAIEVDGEPGRGSAFRVTVPLVRTVVRVSPVRMTEDRNLIDPGVLLATCDRDATFLARVIAVLRSQLPEELAGAHACFDAGDARGLRERAHRLQGMISNASTIVAKVAAELEDEAANHRLETSAGLLARLDTLTRALMKSLESVTIEGLCMQRG